MNTDLIYNIIKHHDPDFGTKPLPEGTVLRGGLSMEGFTLDQVYELVEALENVENEIAKEAPLSEGDLESKILPSLPCPKGLSQERWDKWKKDVITQYKKFSEEWDKQYGFFKP